jgi:hypothetical protein
MSMADGSPAGLDATTPWVRRWLRAEGIAAFAAGATLWGSAGGEWIWFLALLLAPDISMAGYLGGTHTGAIAYNVIHNWFTGGIVLAFGMLLPSTPLVLAGAILVAHTGMDRTLGYGLKYPTAFQDTHLGRIGRRR